ncbi:MAG: septum site-determining protein MinC [Lachnospirales bacterium]
MERITFKGQKNGITIVFDPISSFDDLKIDFKEKLNEVKDFFGHEKTPLVFKGREFSNKEFDELIEILRKNSDIDATFISSDLYISKYSVSPSNNNEINNSAKKVSGGIFKNLKPNKTEEVIEDEVAAPIVTKRLDKQAEVSEVYIHKGNMRSGKSIKFRGNVIVYGDMNPGSEIIAEGNIIVLGNAKGFLYAGCNGDIASTIYALSLEPTQIRIAEHITYIAKEQLKQKKATYAYVEDEKIYIK